MTYTPPTAKQQAMQDAVDRYDEMRDLQEEIDKERYMVFICQCGRDRMQTSLEIARELERKDWTDRVLSALEGQNRDIQQQEKAIRIQDGKLAEARVALDKAIEIWKKTD